MNVTITLEHALLIGALLLLLSVAASKASGRLGVPALVLFLGIGMLAGSDGIGGIYFDDARLAQTVGVIALVFILFSGGLDTMWASIRSVLAIGIALSTVGVVITAGVVGAFAALLLGFTPVEGLLLGAIVSSTDAAAVFTVLRSRDVRLKGRLESLLEFESGSNDPVAVLLTLGLVQLVVNPASSPLALLPQLAVQMTLGGVLGVVIGHAGAWLINHIRLKHDGLYPVLTVAIVLMAYAATSLVGGNGFLAVYLAGLMLNRQDFIHKNSLKRFHDSLAWIMQIVMFLTLGLLVFPSRLVPVALASLLVALVLIFVARPVAVFLTLLPAKFTVREKMLISWVGLRGAVPIILATFPLLANVPRADLLFNIVFFVVLTSILLQGTTIPWIARFLNLNATPAPAPASAGAPSPALAHQLADVVIPAGSPVVGQQIVDLHLPPSVLIVQIARGDERLVPNGGTVLEAGDHVILVSDGPALTQAKLALENKTAG